MLIHLKNDKLIGGYFGNKSFASSFPNTEDLYIEQVWQVSDESEFLEKIDNTQGLLISKDFINYIEFFETTEE